MASLHIDFLLVGLGRAGRWQLFESSAKTDGLVINNYFVCFSHIFFFKNFDVLLPSPRKNNHQQNQRNTFSYQPTKPNQSYNLFPN